MRHMFQFVLIISCFAAGQGLNYEEYIKCLATPGCVPDKPKRTFPLLECLKSADCDIGSPQSSIEPYTKPATGDECTMPDGSIGKCVQKYFCETNKSPGLQTLIDLRSIDGPCESYLDTCCSEGFNTTNTQDSKKSNNCGIRNPDGVGFRIDSDKFSQFGEFPWMVAILKEDVIVGQDYVLKKYVCGGSLIHSNVVLTAGHCVVEYLKDLNNLWIRAGEWDTQTETEIYPHEDIKVDRVVVHENYDNGLANNIALLILEEPVVESPHIGLICLPESDNFSLDCLASGWGKESFGKEEEYQVILKKIQLPLVERSKCEEALRTTRLGSLFRLHQSYICAGGQVGKDTCKGDGGSPLVCPTDDNSHYVQVGIVAWGIGCGQDHIPGVYTNVAHFKDWIREKIVEYDVSRIFDPRQLDSRQVDSTQSNSN